MSDIASPPGESIEAAAPRIRMVGPVGMIAIRGDLQSGAMNAAVKSASGLDIPALRQVSAAGGISLCWMSPDELLLLSSDDAAPALVGQLQGALAREHALVVDVSDARVLFELTGSGVREVLARLCPVDLSPQGLGLGEMRRTRMGQVPAAFWITGQESIRLICFRSVSGYVHDLLRDAAGSASQAPVFGGPV